MQFPGLENFSDYITAAAALGTAAFALVDASKAVFGGVSNCGFRYIKSAVTRFFPENGNNNDTLFNPLQLNEALDTLRANWLNGVALADQKAIAKSLIKLNLNESSAPILAKATGVDVKVLTDVAKKLVSGSEFSTQENDLYGRFDLMLVALLDKGYQRADQSYRNSAKLWAVVASVVLAVVAVLIMNDNDPKHIAGAILLGLAATPIAPIAKDLTSALGAGVKVAQTLRK